MATQLPTTSYMDPSKRTAGPVDLSKAVPAHVNGIPTGIPSPTPTPGAAPSLRPAPRTPPYTASPIPVQRAVQMEALKSTNPAAAPIMPTRTTLAPGTYDPTRVTLPGRAMDGTIPSQTPAPNSSPYGGRVAAFRGLFPGGGQSAAHASPPPFSGQWPGRGQVPGRGPFPGGGQSPNHAAPPAFAGLFPGNGGNNRDNRYTPAQLEARRPINPAAAQFHRQDRG
jgi:hypothetical protein